jgi:cytochrome c553
MPAAICQRLTPLTLAALALSAMAISTTASTETATTAPDSAEAPSEATFRYGGDPERGATMAPLCTSCHGYQGRSVTSRYPSIAGLDETRIVERLEAFQAGEGGHLMASMLRGLSDQDIADLAAYYSQLEP